MTATMACMRLYAHALTLGAWAAVTWVLQLDGTTVVIVLMLSTLCAASWMATRERSRRRRERQGT